MVSFDSSVTHIYDVPFPAVTICNMNRVQKSRAEFVKNKLESEPNIEKWKKEFIFIEEVCGIIDENAVEVNLTNDEVHEYLNSLAQPCKNMLLR